MSKVYFISGLGADKRMFRFIKLPPHVQHEHVHWIAPKTHDEPLQNYVQRLKAQITTPEPILIGLSFGGVVAIELAKIMKVRKVILISSLATRHALPTYYRLLGKLQLHKKLPFKLMQSIYPFASPFFGAHTKVERALLKSAILDIDETFLRWSLGQLLAWPQTQFLPDVIQLHGTADLVLPLYKKRKSIEIQGGEHLMILHRADEINTILGKVLTHDMPNSKFIATLANGQQADLTQATILKSNNLYPFGEHNYAIYETPEGTFIKGLNKGEREIMLTHFELLSETEARQYVHPFIREDQF